MTMKEGTWPGGSGRDLERGDSWRGADDSQVARTGEAGLAGGTPAARSAGAGERWASWLILGVGGLLLGVVLLPVIWCRYFPSHNGPALLGITHLAKHLPDPRWGYETYYEDRFYPVPYLAQHALQWVLLDWVADQRVPGLVTLCAVFLRFWAAWYWLGGVSGGEVRRRWLCWLVLPWALEYVLLRGYVNFHLGSSLALVVYGWYLRHRRNWTWGAMLVWNLLTVATYFCHAVPAALAGLLVAVDDTVRTGQPTRVVGLAVRGFLPVLVLLGAFMLHSRAHSGWGVNEWILSSPVEKVRSVMARLGTPLSTTMRWGGLGLLLLPLLLRVTEPRDDRPGEVPDAMPAGRERWAVPAVWLTMVVVYLACPNSLLGWHKADLHLLPLVPLLWLGATPLPRGGWRAGVVPVAAAVWALTGTAAVDRSLAAGSAQVEEYLSGLEAVPPRVAILSLMGELEQGQVYQPLQWADSYYLIRRGGGLGRGLVQYNTIYPVWFHDWREGGQRQFPPVDDRDPSAEELERAARVYGAAVLWNIPDEITSRLEQVGFERRFRQGHLQILVHRSVGGEPDQCNQ